MAAIKHHQLADYLGRPDNTGLPGVVLVCGEPFLTSQAVKALSDALFKDGGRQFGLETMDGTTAAMGDIIEQAATFSFLAGPKMILVKNAPLFGAAAGTGGISYAEKDLDLLTRTIENGVADQHFLVLVTPTQDRRKKIYKTIEAHGLVVDCTVPQGAGKADLEAQSAILKTIAAKVLSAAGRQMDQNALAALMDLTGFHPELFARNLEKLMAYAGKDSRINLTHVKAVIQRDKKDPIFHLTNVVLDRNAPQALFYVSSLFKDQFHPLQILKSLENQIRKLLAAKFVVAGLSRTHPGIGSALANYNLFRQHASPLILSGDQEMKAILDRDEAVFHDLQDTGETGSKKKKEAGSDLFLAPNPKSLYPVFQLFLKTRNFTLIEIEQALANLADLDHQFKTSALDAKTGIETFIIKLCRKP